MGKLDCALIPGSATEPHKQVEKNKTKKDVQVRNLFLK